MALIVTAAKELLVSGALPVAVQPSALSHSSSSKSLVLPPLLLPIVFKLAELKVIVLPELMFCISCPVKTLLLYFKVYLTCPSPPVKTTLILESFMSLKANRLLVSVAVASELLSIVSTSALFVLVFSNELCVPPISVLNVTVVTRKALFFTRTSS